MGSSLPIAVMRSKERQVREAFNDAQALDPLTAKPLADIGLEESRALQRLQRNEVVRESSPGCFYFEEEAWQALRATRFRMLLMILGALALTALVGVYAVSANQ